MEGVDAWVKTVVVWAQEGGPRFTRSRALALLLCAVYPPPLQGGAASRLIVCVWSLGFRLLCGGVVLCCEFLCEWV